MTVFTKISIIQQLLGPESSLKSKIKAFVVLSTKKTK